MAECTSDCSSCGVEGCGDREKPDFRAYLNEHSNVKKVIGVVSGKGGVGKSLVTSMLAVQACKAGHKTAILDADITGPSIPKAFGLDGIPELAYEKYMIPIKSKTGIDTMSINYLLQNQTDPVVWRGPVIAGAVKQFWTDVIWEDLDVLFIDMPPGTGDIHISLVQDIPMEGAVIVTTPQTVALADVEKGVNMFRNPSINKLVLGLVENMAWFTPAELPDNKYYLFGKDGGKKMAEELGIELLGQVPIVQSIREGGDSGEPVALGSGPDGLAFLEIARKLAE